MKNFSSMNFTAMVFAATVLSTSLFAQSSIKDIIVTTAGRAHRGVEIVEMTSKTIKFKKGSAENELQSKSLARITWHEPPESYGLALAAMRQGKFSDAANFYSEAADKTERAPLKQDAQFHSADALLRAAGGDKAAAGTAVSALEAFLSANPESFYTANAMLLLGRARRIAGQGAAAETVLKELSQKVLSSNWKTIWDARAKLELAKAQISQQKTDDARSSYRAAASAAKSGASSAELTALKAEAVVGEGETYIAKQQYDQALSYFSKLARNEKDSAIKAAAMAGEGEALFLKAKKSGKKDSLRRAQLALAAANLEDTQSGSTTAKALYYSGKVILALGKDRESSDFKVRAMAYFKTVVKFYPNSSWAIAAATELK